MNDVHGPYHDPVAVNLVLDIFEDLNLDGIYLNGDIFDFANISRHNKAKHPDLQMTLEDELHWGQEFFEEIRKRFVMKGKKVIYLKGNHEVWLDQFIIEKCPAFWNICRLESHIDFEGIELHEYNTQIEVENSNLFIQHSPPSYAKTGVYTSIKEKGDASYIWGCTHRISHACVTGSTGKVYHGYFNGWLGSIDYRNDNRLAFKYKKNHKTWQQCFSIVNVIDGIESHVTQVPITNHSAFVDGFRYTP